MIMVTFIRDKVKARQDADYPVVTPDEVELMDVSPTADCLNCCIFDSFLGA